LGEYAPFCRKRCTSPAGTSTGCVRSWTAG